MVPEKFKYIKQFTDRRTYNDQQAIQKVHFTLAQAHWIKTCIKIVTIFLITKRLTENNSCMLLLFMGKQAKAFFKQLIPVKFWFFLFYKKSNLL